MDPNLKFLASNDFPLEDSGQYRQLMGKLIYFTYPDISFTTSVVRQYMQSPRKFYLDAGLRILRYLKRVSGQELLFCCNWYLDREDFFHAYWTHCLDGRRSITSCRTFMRGNLVSWKSKKQNVVPRSM